MNPLVETPDKVVLSGDWHGNGVRGSEVVGFAGRRGIPVVLQLGDFGIWNPGARTDRFLGAVQDACDRYGVTVLFVDGNHEDFDHLYSLPIDADTGMRPVHPNIFHLPRGLRWRWAEQTWMALGGAHSVDRPDRREGRSWWPQEHLTREEVDRAIEPGPVDVIVAHDAPDAVDIPGLSPEQFAPAEIYAADLHRALVAEVVDATEPALYLHGHYHVRYETHRGPTKVIGLGSGEGRLADNVLILDLTR